MWANLPIAWVREKKICDVCLNITLRLRYAFNVSICCYCWTELYRRDSEDDWTAWWRCSINNRNYFSQLYSKLYKQCLWTWISIKSATTISLFLFFLAARKDICRLSLSGKYKYHVRNRRITLLEIYNWVGEWEGVKWTNIGREIGR